MLNILMFFFMFESYNIIKLIGRGNYVMTALSAMGIVTYDFANSSLKFA